MQDNSRKYDKISIKVNIYQRKLSILLFLIDLEILRGGLPHIQKPSSGTWFLGSHLFRTLAHGTRKL